MTRPQFTVRTLLWLTTIVAMGVGWCVQASRTEARHRSELRQALADKEFWQWRAEAKERSRLWLNSALLRSDEARVGLERFIVELAKGKDPESLSGSGAEIYRNVAEHNAPEE